MRGIKENVIMGRLIPAGTGLPAYKKLQVVIDEKSPTYAPPTFTRVQPLSWRLSATNKPYGYRTNSFRRRRRGALSLSLGCHCRSASFGKLADVVR